MASSLPQALLLTDKFLAFCDELGILVYYEKLHLVPSQEDVYLGMKLDSSTLKAFPTQGWILTFLRELEECLSHRLQPAQEWRCLLGRVLSLA